MYMYTCHDNDEGFATVLQYNSPLPEEEMRGRGNGSTRIYLMRNYISSQHISEDQERPFTVDLPSESIEERSLPRRHYNIQTGA